MDREVHLIILEVLRKDVVLSKKIDIIYNEFPAKYIGVGKLCIALTSQKYCFSQQSQETN